MEEAQLLDGVAAHPSATTTEGSELGVPLFRVPDLSVYADPLMKLLASGQLASGPAVSRFEEAFGAYLETPWVVSCGDSSSALTLSLFRAGVRPGDEVLMSPLVCLATSCPVRNLFADIRWCDVDPETGNLDPDDVRRRISRRTKLIVVYHWAGNPADLTAIYAIARDHGLAVVEDAGEALGAEYAGKKIGATGSDFTVFSFYPNRHLTTIEGAAITCRDGENLEALRKLRRYGIDQQTFRDGSGEINPASDIGVAGWNSYMNQVAATLGLLQLERLRETIARYQSNGLYFDQRFSETPGIKTLRRPFGSRSAYWVYTFLAQHRDEMLHRLRQRGVQASGLHVRNDIYSCFSAPAKEMLGVDQFARTALSIPCGWWVGDLERARIADIVFEEAGNCR